MKILFYAELVTIITSILYVGWIFYPYYKEKNSEKLTIKFLVSNHKRRLLYGIVPILLVVTVYLTVGPVRYTNNVYLWQWQQAKVSKLISKEHNIVNTMKSPKNKKRDLKAYNDFVTYISGPKRRLADYEQT